MKVYHRPLLVMFAGPQVGPLVNSPVAVLAVMVYPHVIGSAPAQMAFAGIGPKVVKATGPVT